VRSLELDPQETEAFVKCLFIDPLGRFSLHESDDDDVIIARNILPHEEQVLLSMSSWRDQIALFLEDKKPTELSVIGTMCSRPGNVPSDIKLKELLISDARFQTIGEESGLIRVKLRLDEEEMASIIDEWRDGIYVFLINKNRFVNLSEIGGAVPRPVQLPGSVKMLETLRADTLRFKILGEGNDVKVKGVIQLDDEAFKIHFEEWRSDIVKYIGAVSQPVELSELGFKVKRPSCLKGVGLQQMLSLDPHRRFLLYGKVNQVRVGLSSMHTAYPTRGPADDSWISNGAITPRQHAPFGQIQQTWTSVAAGVKPNMSYMDALKVATDSGEQQPTHHSVYDALLTGMTFPPGFGVVQSPPTNSTWAGDSTFSHDLDSAALDILGGSVLPVPLSISALQPQARYKNFLLRDWLHAALDGFNPSTYDQRIKLDHVIITNPSHIPIGWRISLVASEMMRVS
jgi:hypothetical protein